MAFDGSVVHAITKELDKELTDGRIAKIAQPEKYELQLLIKKEGVQKRLLISVNPSLPMVYLTEQSKPAPLTAPAFCMLLRKHLTGGRILSVTQPSMERIIEFEIEHFNEMGDICRKILTVELMGKYSNIIFREGSRILDSIKHVSALVSSVREVLPGREYYIPFQDEKLNPFDTDETTFTETVFSKGAMPGAKALYTCITGFSPDLSEEIFYRAGQDSDRPASSFTAGEQTAVYDAFRAVMELICREGTACIVYKENEPVSYGVFPYRMFDDPNYTRRPYTSISALLFDYYSQKQDITVIRQKTADMRQTVRTLLNKTYKKYDLQLRQMKDTEKKDRFKVFGELLTAYGYGAEAGSTSFQATDFYTGEEVSIPLDPTVSAVENGKNYFKKYAKLKRTAEALDGIILETKAEIDHLESIMVSLDMVQNQEDIAQIRRELSESGYTRKQSGDNARQKGKPGRQSGAGGKSPVKSAPLHYISSDGFHMYVGKNNYQNEYITFKLAAGNDWWFHAMNIPGSHVIVRTEGAQLPDRTFEEAASLAAHYSKSGTDSKVEVQYTQKKNLKKPPAAKPGFVVFHTYFSMAADTDISSITEQ